MSGLQVFALEISTEGKQMWHQSQSSPRDVVSEFILAERMALNLGFSVWIKAQLSQNCKTGVNLQYHVCRCNTMQ